MVFDTLSNCKVCLIRPSEDKPHPILQRVGENLGEATVFGLVVSVNRLAN